MEAGPEKIRKENDQVLQDCGMKESKKNEKELWSLIEDLEIVKDLKKKEIMTKLKNTWDNTFCIIDNMVIHIEIG